MASREAGRFRAEVRALGEQMREERSRHAARGRELARMRRSMTKLVVLREADILDHEAALAGLRAELDKRASFEDVERLQALLKMRGAEVVRLRGLLTDAEGVRDRALGELGRADQDRGVLRAKAEEQDEQLARYERALGVLLSEASDDAGARILLGLRTGRWR